MNMSDSKKKIKIAGLPDFSWRLILVVGTALIIEITSFLVLKFSQKKRVIKFDMQMHLDVKE